MLYNLFSDLVSELKVPSEYTQACVYRLEKKMQNGCTDGVPTFVFCITRSCGSTLTASK